jgi:hypothetical protein
MVASVEPRVKGMACAEAFPGLEESGERLRLPGAASVPGAPMPDEVATALVAMIVLYLKEGEIGLSESVLMEPNSQDFQGAEHHDHFE